MKRSLFYGLLLSFSVIALSCGDDPTCDDGIQNGDETGIDCGGDCAACPTCSDGIQNGDETDVDCGGSICDLCATCSDGIQNGNETDVDCGGDCTPCVTTVAEDKENIQKTFDDLLTCVSDFKNSRSIDIFFRNFLKLSDGDILNENWVEDLVEDLEDVIDVDHIDNNQRLDFMYHAGTHIFEQSTQTWSKVNNVNNQMVFLFPSDPTLSTNNVELIMDAYEDKLVEIDGESVYLPTSAHVVMNVDNVKMMEINLNKIVYADNQDFEIPVEVSASLFMDPINITLDMVRVSTTEYRLESTIEDGSSCSIGLEIDVELKDDDFENLSNDGFEKVHVKLNVGRMTIQSLADIASLIALSDNNDVSDTQANSLMDIDALFDGIKIADIEISEEQETVLIFYKDLTSEDSKIYYESFWEDVKNLWTEFFG